MKRALGYTLFALWFMGCSPHVDGGRRDGGGSGDDLSVSDTDGSPTQYDLTSCVNLQCRQVSCPVGQETTLTGTVMTPKGDLPLYNVSVFVPNGSVQPVTDGVSCDSCASFSAAMPLVSALTGPDGTFTLKNVPTGANVPVVLQVGKWRKQITIPNVTACTTAAIDPMQLNMPRNKSEGDIPRIAIATGSADPFECLLLKVGLDPAEITAPTGNGRVSYYRTNDSNGSDAASGIDLSGGAPDAKMLFDDLDTLKKHDIVLLPCEGAEWGGKTAAETANMRMYADLGGRLFTTHFSYTWIYGTKGGTPLPWSSTGTWDVRQSYDVATGSTLTGKIDTSFPKGMAFSQWLTNVGASTTPDQLVINEWRHDLDPPAVAQATRWVYGATPAGRYANSDLCIVDHDCSPANRPCVGVDPLNGIPGHCTTAFPAASMDNSIQHITFNTPVDQPVANQCGRVVYSDFHVSAAALKDPSDSTNQGTFPSICKSEPPSAQEKALIFMLFDLSACVQDDSKPPEPPPIL